MLVVLESFGIHIVGLAATVPFPVLLLLSHFLVTELLFFFFWCCRVIVPCPPFLSLFFRISRKASLTPCQIQALVPSTDLAILHFLLLG